MRELSCFIKVHPCVETPQDKWYNDFDQGSKQTDECTIEGIEENPGACRALLWLLRVLGKMEKPNLVPTHSQANN